jgi:hypothetical protein
MLRVVQHALLADLCCWAWRYAVWQALGLFFGVVGRQHLFQSFALPV